jgi:hypothetical protein
MVTVRRRRGEGKEEEKKKDEGSILLFQVFWQEVWSYHDPQRPSHRPDLTVTP